MAIERQAEPRGDFGLRIETFAAVFSGVAPSGFRRRIAQRGMPAIEAIDQSDFESPAAQPCGPIKQAQRLGPQVIRRHVGYPGIDEQDSGIHRARAKIWETDFGRRRAKNAHRRVRPRAVRMLFSSPDKKEGRDRPKHPPSPILPFMTYFAQMTPAYQFSTRISKWACGWTHAGQALGASGPSCR
ncbi:MAG: hypothetical protein BWZ10_02866 [candidate division BRC1 bacterium ADurb.BinA364]|nr:MAG: hypothetical protein BWZ10_02866 [candidate division BRC1 bacterium ADurb.BinA364]